MKILIVDDNAEDRAILCHYLTPFASKILEAANGNQGLATARSELPDLIISDALMPQMDGFEFLREVRRSDDIRNTRFIFYSAVYTGCRDEELARSLGADAFLVKPLEPMQFLHQIRNLLDSPNGTTERITSELLLEEEKYLREYSRMVAARLEEKVHELQSANRKLALSETRYRNLFSSMRDVIIVSDQSHNIIDVNQPALRDVFGFDTSDVLNKSLFAVCGSEQNFELLEQSPGESDGFSKGLLQEIKLNRKDGSLFTGELHAFRLLDDCGNQNGNVTVIRDVTEHRKTEAQLHHSQRMESIGILAGGVAHDFNNLLTGIIGYGSMTLMKMTENDPHRINIQHILEASERAAQLTRELLMFSRKQVLDRRPADLNAIVDKVHKFLKRVIGEDITIRIMLNDSELPIQVDHFQIEQVLMNLATNARDSMPHGGTITISTAPASFEADFMNRHGYGKSGSYALINVSDTGMGMDHDTLQRIFEPFFTTKSVGKGTGLGLSVAYGIISQHDGYINAYSEPGHGTTFRVYLPLTTGDGLYAEPAKVEQKPIRGMETILLAEDNELVREMTGEVLTEHGYTVIEACNGAEAVKMFKENKESIKLLLFDMIMPIMNGKDARDEIYKIKPGIKTLFASGYAPDFVLEKLSHDNGIHLITKPVSPTELLTKVRSILDVKDQE